MIWMFLALHGLLSVYAHPNPCFELKDTVQPCTGQQGGVICRVPATVEAGMIGLIALAEGVLHTNARGKALEANVRKGGRAMKLVFEVSDSWQKAFTGAHAGVLLMRDAANPPHHPALDEKKTDLERQLRELYGGASRSQLGKHPVMMAYTDYYRLFDKTYHVRLQLESIVFKGKPIASASSLVEAMFIAELKNMILTAGHDLDSIRPPIILEVSKGEERYVLLNGKEQSLKPGDMVMSDREGVISSVLYGPDKRTRIRPQTRDVVFTVYAPRGIREEDVRRHLHDIEANVRIIAPQARVEMMEVFGGLP